MITSGPAQLPCLRPSVATGRIIAAQSNRRRPIEFLGFMNSVVVKFPDRELHGVLDNFNTHKKNERAG
jgi:hypothetical protein